MYRRTKHVEMSNTRTEACQVPRSGAQISIRTKSAQSQPSADKRSTRQKIYRPDCFLTLTKVDCLSFLVCPPPLPTLKVPWQRPVIVLPAPVEFAFETGTLKLKNGPWVSEFKTFLAVLRKHEAGE